MCRISKRGRGRGRKGEGGKERERESVCVQLVPLEYIVQSIKRRINSFTLLSSPSIAKTMPALARVHNKEASYRFIENMLISCQTSLS